MGRKKVINVVAQVSHPVTLEWVAESRIARDFDLSFAVLNPVPTQFEKFLKKLGVPVHCIAYNGRRQIPRVAVNLFDHFRKLRPDVVHTHLVDSNLAALPVAWSTGVPKRIHTRHHSDPNHHMHRHALLYDYVASALSTDIVAASNNVKQVLIGLEHVKSSKIHQIPFGLKFSEYDGVTEQRIQGLRAKYKLEKAGPIIGVVSRYLEIKGVQYIIPAFAEVLKRYPSACLLITNANEGSHRKTIKESLKALPAANYREIDFEMDMAAFYQVFDIFVHAPVNAVCEAFGQAYTESLAARRPCIFTLSGIAPEFIVDGHNALVVPFRDSAAISQALFRLLADRPFAEALGKQGRRDVEKHFGLEAMIDGLSRLYES